MSGILGFIYCRAADDAAATLGRMSEAMAHRGNPSHTFLHQNRLGVATRHWPGGGHSTSVLADSERLCVVDGLIFNLPELAAELGLAGEKRAEPATAAEIVWHLLDRHGPAAMNRLDGPFALLTWDARRSRVVLGRDLFGHRQLYFARRDGHFWWATEMKAILADARFSPRANEALIPEIVGIGLTIRPETAFRDVFRVMPGHYLHGTLEGELELVRHYNPTLPAESDRSEQEHARQVWELLNAQVRAVHAVCPRQAVLLSGGIDSALLAKLMAEASGGAAMAISAGAADWPGDESGLAEQTAARCGLPCRRMLISSDDNLLGHFRRLVWEVEQPTRFDNSWALQAALAGIDDLPTGLMTGEGGDTVLGSYATLRAYRLRRLNDLPGLLRRGLRWLSPVLTRLPGIAPWTEVLPYSTIHELILGTRGVPMNEPSQPWDVPIPAHLQRFADDLADWPGPAHRAVLVATGYTSVWNERFDAMAAGFRCESFSPFYSRSILEYACSMPIRHLHDGRRDKPVLRRLAVQKCWDVLADRRKRPLASPTAMWLRSSAQVRAAVQDLARPGHRIRQFLPGARVDEYLQRLHASGARDDEARWAVMRMLSLELWLEVFFEGARRHGGAGAAGQPRPPAPARPARG